MAGAVLPNGTQSWHTMVDSDELEGPMGSALYEIAEETVVRVRP